MKPLFPFLLMVAVCAPPLPAATLERLSVDQMIIKSTAIVRGKVTGSYTSAVGPVFYTHYRVEVSETLKGAPRGAVELVYPGGTVNNQVQTFAGVPKINAGEEYIFFLWAGKSGLTQVVGLTQGLFAVAREHSADPLAVRAASSELMLDGATGQAVKDQTVTLHLSEIRSRVKYIMTGAAN